MGLQGVRTKIVVFVVLLGAVAALAWWQHAPLLSWYYVKRLAQADEKDRLTWVQRVAGLDEAAVPRLIELLHRDDAKVCANSSAALAALATRWGPADDRTGALAERLTDNLSSVSTPGREATLDWCLAVVHNLDANKGASPRVKAAAGKMLLMTSSAQDKRVCVRALALAEILLELGTPPSVELCREMAMRGLTNPDAGIRAQAIRLTMLAPLHAEKPLIDRVLPLLKDASPVVRRAAVLALGLAEETLSIQDLLPLLHDPDADVRRLCAEALGCRGLSAAHIELARKISDQQASERLKVVKDLDRAEDLDPGIWLQHLSQDSSPAVRAAAIRFAAENTASVNFQERMQQMAREDPSPTVRQLAGFYLTAYRNNSRGGLR